MADITLAFGGASRQIGLIVRGKQGPDQHPGSMEQHADVILQDGSPVGFYGEGNDRSVNGIGMMMQGVVYDYDRLRIERPYYVDADSAVANRVVSTVLLVDADKTQADAFDAAWARMTIQPGSFNILGGNCSTHASAGFLEAGVLTRGIPGLDTPDHLCGQLTTDLPASRLHSYTGFLGFTRVPSGGFTLTIKPFTASPAVNKPNPGRSGSLGSNA